MQRFSPKAPIKLFIAALFCACIIQSTQGDDPPAKRAGKGKALYEPKITISKETTWAIEPVGPRGFVDYTSIIDRLGRQRATPENNAAVLLYQATGRVLEQHRQPDEIFTRLGIAPPTEEGDYFVPLARWMTQTDTDWSREQIEEKRQATTKRAWTASEFPLFAEWLKSIETPLKQAILAASRTEYYSPSIPKDGPEGKFIEIPLPALQTARLLAHAIISRAMLRLGDQDPKASWTDLIAAHRLGRLIGRGPLEIEGVVGREIEKLAMDAELLFLSETQPSSVELISQYVQSLDAIPARSLITDKINESARMMSLDSCLQVARGRMKFRDLLPGKSGNTVIEDAVEAMMLQSVDWDHVLKSVNQLYDSQVEAAKLPTYHGRMTELRKLEAALRKAAGPELRLNPHSLVGNRPKATQYTTAFFGRIFAGWLYRSVCPDANCIQQFQNLKLAFALAAWRSEHQTYPEDLTELKPKYIAEIPIDLFNEQPLHYKRVDDGYLLYSVGINEEDNESAKSRETFNSDDIIVKMPVSR